MWETANTGGYPGEGRVLTGCVPGAPGPDARLEVAPGVEQMSPAERPAWRGLAEGGERRRARGHLLSAEQEQKNGRQLGVALAGGFWAPGLQNVRRACPVRDCGYRCSLQRGVALGGGVPGRQRGWGPAPRAHPPAPPAPSPAPAPGPQPAPSRTQHLASETAFDQLSFQLDLTLTLLLNRCVLLGTMDVSPNFTLCTFTRTVCCASSTWGAAGCGAAGRSGSLWRWHGGCGL